jgi:hypothetical protein
MCTALYHGSQGRLTDDTDDKKVTDEKEEKIVGKSSLPAIPDIQLMSQLSTNPTFRS